MSKTAKKLLSVVLAVLVLAAGFSTTLGAFKPVSAEEVVNLDYTSLVTEVTTNNKTNDANGERGLVTYAFGQASNYYVVAPDSFYLYDVMGFGTNYDPDHNRSGLRIEDFFFQHKSPDRIYSVGADREDIHPYVTYEVEGGTSFTTEYLTYDEGSWAGQGLGDRTEELMYLNILVSSDGVNFIPAKVENTLVDTGAYYRVTALIKNVGANTRYVKIQSNIDPTTVSYKNGEVYYYPQEAHFIQKVTFTKSTATDAGVTKLSFLNNTVTKDGTEVGNTDANIKSVFTSSSRTPNLHAYGLAALGWGDLGASTTVSVEQADGTFKDQTWYNGGTTKVLGTIAESDRDFFLRVQPGTRFTLTWNNYGGHEDVAKALAGGYKAFKDGKEGYDAYAEYETHEDFAIRVYTAANNAGEWTEHRMAPSVIYANSAMSFSFNFIIPEGHTYVRIVNPISGALGGVMKLGEDGYPLENAFVNHVTNSAGNDWIRISDISYTAFDASSIEYDATYNYLSGGDKTAPYVNKYVDAGSGLAAQGYSATPYKANYPVLNTDKERTEEQLPYAVWKVVGDSFFKATVELPYKWKVNHDNMKSANAKEEMHFEISTSVDGVDWTVQNTFGKKANPCDVMYPYTEADAPHNKAFDIETYIPAGVNFVRVRTYCYGAKSTVTFDENGAYVSESGVTCDNDTFVINSVSLTNTVVTSEEEQMGEVTYAYNDLTKYPYGTSYATTESLSAAAVVYNETKFSSLTSSVAASNVTLDNYAGNKFGITMIYKNYGANSGTAERPYIIYKVNPGTQFVANVMVDYATKVAAEKEDTNLESGVVKAPFEFYFSTAASLDGEFTEQFRTTTGSNADQHVVVNVPKTASYVKVEFPQTGNVGGGVKNHQARLLNVAYVPFGYEYGQQTYNYEDEIGTATAVSSSSDEAAFNNLVGSYAAKNNLTLQENWPNDTFTGGLWADARGGKPGTAARAYLVYNVEPGTTFRMNTGISVSVRNLYIQYGATDFEFIFSTSASADSGFVEFTRTNTTETSGNSYRTVEFTVPAGANFVKVEFPQTGMVYEGDFGEDLDGDGTLNEYLTWGNHAAMIYDVAFVPNGVKEPVSENDYTAKDEVSFTDANKVDYNLYNLKDVEGTANGVVAKADATEAFVEYKVSNEEALVIKTANDLKIAVSYDGVSFVDAELSNYAGAYTVNLLDGKQYVRVYLGEGDAITAVTAKHLNPTATFINAAGTTESVDVAYGAIPAAPALNTNRAGYTFDKWGKDGLIEGIYLDTVYEATYNKDETNLFTVGLKEGSEGEISVNNDRALTEVRFDDRVTVEAPATYADDVNTLTFDKWIAYDLKGNKIGTISNSHKFSFLASGSILLYAEYVNEGESKTEDKPFIFNNSLATVEDNTDGTWNMSVIWRVNAPADAVVSKTGILFAATNLGDNAAWEAGIAAGTAKVIAHKTTAANKTLMYTVNNITAAKDARFALPYAIVDGEYVFGNVVSATEVITYGATYDYSTLTAGGYWNGEEQRATLGAAAICDKMLEKNAARAGLEPNYGNLAAEWGTVEFSITYKVKPGSKFEATFALIGNDKRTAWKTNNQGAEFEFKIEASSAIDSGWKEAVDTTGMSGTVLYEYAGSNMEEIVMTYDVPADCEYVKVTLPQKGILPGTEDTRLNDFAYLAGVRYTAE